MAAASDESALAAAFVALSNVRDSKYTYVASMTVMVYDMLLTLSEEVATIWSGKGSIGKYLFLVNRYVAPILFTFDLYYQLSPHPSLEDSSPDKSCKRAYLPPNLLGIASLTSVEFILVLRTYALYRSKALLALLSFFCAISAATMMGASLYLSVNVVELQNPSFPPPIQVGCTANCASPICRRLLTAFWIPFFFTETVIFILTLRKSYGSVVGMTSQSKLVQVFYRDGFMYYVVVMCISIANLLVWIAAPVSLSYIATSVMRSLQVTVGSRILLNIRSANSDDYIASYSRTVTSSSTQELSGMNFVVPAAAARLRAQEQSIMFSEVTSRSFGELQVYDSSDE
ncbi:uncharacterized protein SCHCODRAFT_01126959 [Schizophyllum commune H4-8]|nr:uncharacterized protein SCHCODRAFT_01126959 [Schizophyllum commune H4-8]KAI5891181.1 hypothetical protein SCHCODRAFT_01126959 [Schizophyllum commune H4-8]